jgi:ATP-dependent DNA ligase
MVAASNAPDARISKLMPRKGQPKAEGFNFNAEYPKLRLPVRPPFPPMETRSVKEIPPGKQWLYEPKWDGFRCLAFRDGETVALQSKAGQPLGRYFTELVDALLKLDVKKFALDGEIFIEADGQHDFDALLQRIHPAESRIKKLSRETPCTYMIFDILVDDMGASLIEQSLVERKRRLREFFRQYAARNRTLKLAESTDDFAEAQSWLKNLGRFGGDGVIAKLANEPYHSGDRQGMVKIKALRTADCVVGGFRYATKKESGVGSLLLGLYNEGGQLDHVGFSSSFTAPQRLELLKKLARYRKGSGFTGKAPGGPSRWSRNTDRSSEWESLDPKLVVEVQYDHFSGGRFRHGTKLLRWRPDKSPRQCTMDQVRLLRRKVA